MFQMNFKGIYLIFLNRLKEMFLSLQELTYNHSVPSNPCPIQPLSHPTPLSPILNLNYPNSLKHIFLLFKKLLKIVTSASSNKEVHVRFSIVYFGDKENVPENE